MSRQNAEEEKSTQAASKSQGDRKSILLWRSLLDSPDKKWCPLKSWSKHYVETRMMKKSQIIWHKWGKLHLKKEHTWTEALYNLSFHRDVCCFSSALKKFCISVDISIFFILMQIKNCTCSKAITPTRSPSGSKMDLCWVTATWRIRAKPEQQKKHVPYQTALYLWCHIKRKEHSHLNSLCQVHSWHRTRRKKGKMCKIQLVCGFLPLTDVT